MPIYSNVVLVHALFCVCVCTGNFLLGGMFSLYADLLVTVLAQAAVELVNTGKDWEPEFSGATLSLSLSLYLSVHMSTNISCATGA